MKYDFTSVIDRTGKDSIAWENIPVPIDDAVVIFLGRIEISEHLMLQTLRNRFAN